MTSAGDDLRAPAAAALALDSPFAFISKVRDSATADLALMRSRAESLRSIAGREFEQFLTSASAAGPRAAPLGPGTPIAELEFVRRTIQPRISELRRNYVPPGINRRVLERWTPAGVTRLDLSSITAVRNAIVAEVDEFGGVRDFRWAATPTRGRARRPVAANGDEAGAKEWELVKMMKSAIQELEKKSQSAEIFRSLPGSEFVEKLKLSLKSISLEPLGSKDNVPPLDISEIIAHLVRQSSPFLDQLGIHQDLSDKLIQVLTSKRRDQPVPSNHSSDTSLTGRESAKSKLDLRIACLVESTGYHLEDGFLDDYSPSHDARDKKRHLAIVTTASLPWMTGTAVNPLFRAAYLAKTTKQDVTLVIPWLCKSDQELVYPNSMIFSSPKEQEAYIRNWLEERLGFKSDFKISFYPGKFSKERRSIIPSGDTSQFIPSNEADIAILEEPEHLNWYHHGKRWTDKFNHVVGVVHTNYLEYIKREKNGPIQAFFVKHINNWVTRVHCHKVLRLSAATQDMPKSIICNVHGVNPKFLKIGERVASKPRQQAFSKGAYFLGKMVWAKGYRELIDLLAKHRNELEGFKLDVYGSGEDSQEVKSAAQNLNLDVNFFGARDHADDSLHGYKVFINPSVSDVLCTATSEALAMGKFVVCADHPSNDFFRAFPNCLTYKSSDEFIEKVKLALSQEPQPLTEEQRHSLSWEAATQRFMRHSDIDRVLASRPTKDNRLVTMPLPNLSDAMDRGLAFVHYCLTGSETLRLATGAVPGTRDYDREHYKDLQLLPAQEAQRHPVYSW